MPPGNPPAALAKPHKPYFFYGHRKPAQDRPTVRGGIFSNRQSITLNRLTQPTSAGHDSFDFQKWDPDEKIHGKQLYAKDPSVVFFALAKYLSPIARYIVDSFRKHKRWGPPLVEELNRLRRVTPNLVTEVLKFPNVDPRLSSNFFNWAGMQLKFSFRW